MSQSNQNFFQLIWLTIFVISFSNVGSTTQLSLLAPPSEMVSIPEGIVSMGSTEGQPDEKPITPVEIPAFRLQQTEVTNQQFAEFVRQSGYLTTAERVGWGWVWEKKWSKVTGATWRHPHGPDTNILKLDHHPAVQVSWMDATEYCQWYGMRLPTDVEWEYAAKGTTTYRYPWGDTAPRDQNSQRANYGSDRCCSPDAQDGYLFTAPVGSYPAGRSPFGLDDMAGNVWEWVQDDYARHPEHKIIRGGGWGNNAYCLRTSYRHSNLPVASLNMVGFRCAESI